MGRNTKRKNHSVTELKKINCFDVIKYVDKENNLYELRYEDYIIETFDNYNDMIEYAKKFDYSFFYEDNWKEILEERINNLLSKIA